jgi:O-antigen ligase
MGNSLSNNKKITLDFRKMTLFFVCVYIISIYLSSASELISYAGRLSLTLMAGGAIVTVLTERKIKLNSYAIWYVLFLGVCTLSTLYAPIGANVISSLYSLIVVLVIGVVLSISVREKKDIDVVFALMVISSALLMIYLFATGYISEYEASEESGKRFGNELTGNANSFASIFMISACASVYFFFTKRKNIIKVLCVVPFSLQLYGLVLAGSRKNILIPFIMICLISIQMKNKHSKHNVMIKTFVAVAAMFFGYWLLINVPFLYDNIGYRFETIVDYSTGAASSADVSAMTREAMREKALELWVQSPILGNGMGSFKQISGFSTYSHNNMVEVLCNQGVIGFFVFYMYFAYLLYILIKKRRENTELNRFFVAFVVCEIIYEYGAITYNAVPNHIMLALASVALNLMPTSLKEKNQN